MSGKSPEAFALHAVLTRLISCFVNEKLAVGVFHRETNRGYIAGSLDSDSDHVEFPLTSVAFSEPIPGSDAIHVTQLDPWDIPPPANFSISGRPITSHTEVLQLLAKWHPDFAVQVPLLEYEVNSCYSNILEVYRGKLRQCPTLETGYLEWEDSVVEGSATHPMFKSRYPYSPLIDTAKLKDPTISFISIPASAVTIRGTYLSSIQPLISVLNIPAPIDERVIIPVHIVQLPFILSTFPTDNIKILPQSCPARAQTSVRTLTPLHSTPPFTPLLENTAIKCAVAVKITSALRTISPWSTQIGEAFAPVWDKMTHLDQNILHICREIGGISHNDPDFDKAKHLACILRQEPTSFMKPGESVALCAGLVERADILGEESVVVKAWKLDTLAKRVQFLEDYTELAVRCFIPPLIEHGFAFEAHGQNTLLHYNVATGKLLGFSIRDFGALKVWQDDMFASIGERVELLKGNAAERPSRADLYDIFYHKFIQFHLHRLVRALSLQYPTSPSDHPSPGWRIIRKILLRHIPPDTQLYKMWLSEDAKSIKYKCFVRMKVSGLYREYSYEDAPNLLDLGREVNVPVSGSSKSRCVLM